MKAYHDKEESHDRFPPPELGSSCLDAFEVRETPRHGSTASHSGIGQESRLHQTAVGLFRTSSSRLLNNVQDPAARAPQEELQRCRQEAEQACTTPHAPRICAQ